MADSGSPTSSDPRSPAHRIRDMQVDGLLSEGELDKLGFIYPGMPNQDLLNVYRDLRNKLFRITDYENFVCLVSSLSPGGDTSSLTLNLGAVIAFDKSRSALVIDCDPKSNRIDDLIAQTGDEGEQIGLIEFIEGEMDDVRDLIQDCGVDRLRVVTSGGSTTTRTESLESRRMQEIAIELKSRYADRYIFINAPSVEMSSEVQVLANISDMIIFELLPGTVTPQEIKAAVELIGAEKVAGIVLKEL